MRARNVMFVAALALAFTFTGCSDSVVGTEDGPSTPLLKKGGNGGGGGGGNGGGGGKPGGGDPTERPITVTFADRGIASDRGGPYADGTCGVWANIGNLDDARLDPDRNYKGKVAKQCDRRVLVFNFTDGTGQVSTGAFMNIDGLDAMSVNDVITTQAQFNVCGPLVYASVRATRTSATTWDVTTDGASADAFCSGRGTLNTMPFSLTIVVQ
jgi:hypothetical protein